METIFSGLCLIVKLVHSVEGLGIRVYSMASESPDKDTEPNDSVRSQLMKIDLEVLQNFSNHFVQRKPQSCSKEAPKNYHLIFFPVLEWFLLRQNESASSQLLRSSLTLSS
jgi:hypothetical protein